MEIHSTRWIQRDIHPGNIAFDAKTQKLLLINWSKAIQFQVLLKKLPQTDYFQDALFLNDEPIVSLKSRLFTCAPELKDGMNVGPSMDVYATGMVLQYVSSNFNDFEIVSGFTSIILRHLSG